MGGVRGNLVVNYNIAAMLEIVFMCSVNVFGVITGYLYTGREKHSSFSLIKLLVAFVLYSVLVTICIMKIYTDAIHGKGEIIRNLFPFGTRLWYITAYIFVFFMIPYMNRFIKAIDKKNYLRFLIILVILLSVLSVVGDFFGLYMGYSCFWLIVCYFLGGYIKIYKIELKRKISLLLFFGSCFVLFLLNVSMQFLNSNFIYKLYGKILAYTSPLIVINSISIFLFFKTINVCNQKIRKILKICSTSAYAVYIIHAHGLILDNVLYPLMPTRLNNNPFEFLGFGLLVVVVVFLFGIFIDIIRLKIEQLIKIDSFYKRISGKIDSLLLWGYEDK